MKKIISNILIILIIILVITWIAIIFVDYFTVRNNKDPMFCLKEEVKTYNDGKVYICTGLGYKIYNYDRKSISAAEFGPFFIKERKGE